MWSSWSWKAAVICTLVAVNLTGENALKLDVQYPVSGNYSVVHATCRDVFDDKLSGAEFLKNGTVLTSGVASHQVTITETRDGEIFFIFTQEQEGVFSCQEGENRSASIGLAASPPINYDGISFGHYVNSHETNLSCPIRPGALEGNYKVEWKYNFSEIIGYFFDISVTVNASLSYSRPAYRCGVYIQHRSDLQDNITLYSGPVIIIIATHPVPTISSTELTIATTYPPPIVSSIDPTSVPSTTFTIELQSSIAPSADFTIVPPTDDNEATKPGRIRGLIEGVTGGVGIALIITLLLLVVIIREVKRHQILRKRNRDSSVDIPEIRSIASLRFSHPLEMSDFTAPSCVHEHDCTPVYRGHDSLCDQSSCLPDYVKLIATLSNCSSEGRRYVDKTNDFTLEIPEGAIPERESITIDIAVALYGPFQYPEGFRPVSPVFWVCVHEKTNFQFSKPVAVTIPHFLNLENTDDIESLGLTFLKGHHQMNSQHMYQFQPTNGDMTFEPLKMYGVLQTTHFCYLCITSKVSRKTIRKAMFCLYAAIPSAMSPREPAYVYFFVTFLLSTCLDTVRKQIMKMPELQDHISKEQDFQFYKDSDDPALEIVLPQSAAPGWTVGLQFNTQILLSDIDFVPSDKDVIKLKEEEGMYPPRFHVVISCTATTTQSQARIEFRGAVKDIVFDVPLNPLQSLVTTSPRCEEMPPCPLTLATFTAYIASQIPTQWETFGILLGIPFPELKTYPPTNSFACVFDSWEKRGTPELSWHTVVEVLETPPLDENVLAGKVRKMLKMNSLSTTSPVDMSVDMSSTAPVTQQ